MPTTTSSLPVQVPTLTEGLSTTLAGRVLLAIAASAVVALSAHIALPLPFTPVPLSLQPLAVLGVGLALGPQLGFAALCAYLLEGAAGLPVFSPTGPGSLAQLFGPTGGFLFADPFVACMAGALTQSGLRRGLPSFPAALLASIAAIAALFTSGATWLAVQLHLPAATAFHQAVLPFLPGEAIKILAAAGTYRALAPRAGSR